MDFLSFEDNRVGDILESCADGSLGVDEGVRELLDEEDVLQELRANPELVAFFARHVAFQLRAGSMPRARAAAWIALRDGVAFHVLPPLPALAPRPERGDAALFLPPGGEPDEEMTELYVAALESGALDRCLADAEREGRAPAVPAARRAPAAPPAVPPLAARRAARGSLAPRAACGRQS